MIGDFRETFKEEAFELLNSLENLLLELEENPENDESIAAVFRVMHTIKGSASMFGYQGIGDFAHEVEAILDDVRNKKIHVSNVLINLTLKARDHIRLRLETDLDDDSTIQEAEKLKSELRAFMENERNKTARDDKTLLSSQGIPVTFRTSFPDLEEEDQNQCTDTDEVLYGTYRIRFHPSESIFLRGTNPFLLLHELSELSEYMSAVCETKEIPELDTIAVDSCYINWTIFLTTKADLNQLHDVFIFIENESEITIELIEKNVSCDYETGYKKLGEILIERGSIDKETLLNALNNQKKLGEVLIEKELATKDEIESALIEQDHIKQIHENRSILSNGNSIRVNSVKLDELVDLVGELVTVQARLSQSVVSGDYQDISIVAERLERLTNDLRDNTMSIRMLPIGTTFSKFRRLVRDLSSDLGKKIDLRTEGAETELDKTVIEKLNDPLVHIIRNSIDHGIETPKERSRQNKPETGTITMMARHEGSSVQIIIHDDGQGLRKDRIREKAIQKGIISSGTSLSDQELFSLVFAPGFSTCETVTSVSGRGVGMDVVKKMIDSLRGSISIDSESGLGTTITITLPLTLAIIEGLLVRSGGESFVLPLSQVESCIELDNENCKKDKNMVVYRDSLLPYIRLRDLFFIEGTAPLLEQVVVVRVHDSILGIVVDEVIGGHQTVIKTLGSVYKNIDEISGATILGNGNIALILDLNHIFQNIWTAEKGMHGK